MVRELIYEENFVCPYEYTINKFDEKIHKKVFETFEELSNHMVVTHWQGMDIHFKPSEKSFSGKFEA